MPGLLQVILAEAEQVQMPSGWNGAFIGVFFLALIGVFIWWLRR